MRKNTDKPSAEAKALSLFLMAYKTTSPSFKEQAKRINKQWDLVQSGELNKGDYIAEVQEMLDSYGGYEEVIEKTVRYYIKTTGEWKLEGKDKYSTDAKLIADKITGK